MKTTVRPRKIFKGDQAGQKSSGKTPGKPKVVAKLSRRNADIPADRGANEIESTTQGSE